MADDRDMTLTLPLDTWEWMASTLPQVETGDAVAAAVKRAEEEAVVVAAGDGGAGGAGGATIEEVHKAYLRLGAAGLGQGAEAKALHIWQSINLRNLRENIHPTRRRAHLILRKQGDHSVQRIDLRTH